jgi:hypothetical protein
VAGGPVATAQHGDAGKPLDGQTIGGLNVTPRCELEVDSRFIGDEIEERARTPAAPVTARSLL